MPDNKDAKKNAQKDDKDAKQAALNAAKEKLLAKGKLDQALKEYLRVLEDNPKDISTLNKVGDLYVRSDVMPRLWGTLASTNWDNRNDHGYRLMQYGTGNLSILVGLENLPGMGRTPGGRRKSTANRPRNRARRDRCR